MYTQHKMQNSASSICACTSLKKASRIVTRYYEKRLSAAGLTATQFAILKAVQRNVSVPMSDLAEQMVMDRTSLYRALGPLLREKLVKQANDKHDGRVKTIALTERGEKKILEGQNCWKEAQSEFLQTLGEQQWESLLKVLSQVIEGIGHIMER